MIAYFYGATFTADGKRKYSDLRGTFDIDDVLAVAMRARSQCADDDPEPSNYSSGFLQLLGEEESFRVPLAASELPEECQRDSNMYNGRVRHCNAIFEDLFLSVHNPKLIGSSNHIYYGIVERFCAAVRVHTLIELWEKDIVGVSTANFETLQAEVVAAYKASRIVGMFRKGRRDIKALEDIEAEWFNVDYCKANATAGFAHPSSIVRAFVKQAIGGAHA